MPPTNAPNGPPIEAPSNAPPTPAPMPVRISRYLIANPDYGFKIDGYLSVNGEDCKVNREKVVGTLDDLKKYLKEKGIPVRL